MMLEQFVRNNLSQLLNTNYTVYSTSKSNFKYFLYLIYFSAYTVFCNCAIVFYFSEWRCVLKVLNIKDKA